MGVLLQSLVLKIVLSVHAITVMKYAVCPQERCVKETRNFYLSNHLLH